MSDRFFRPGYEHRPAAGTYVVADMVLLTPERVEKVRLESNDEWLLVGCVAARAHVLGGEARPPAVWLDGTKLYWVGEDGASTGNPVPPQEALRR